MIQTEDDAVDRWCRGSQPYACSGCGTMVCVGSLLVAHPFKDVWIKLAARLNDETAAPHRCPGPVWRKAAEIAAWDRLNALIHLNVTKRLLAGRRPAWLGPGLLEEPDPATHKWRAAPPPKPSRDQGVDERFRL